jgi:hypothetical protein
LRQHISCMNRRRDPDYISVSRSYSRVAAAKARTSLLTTGGRELSVECSAAAASNPAGADRHRGRGAQRVARRSSTIRGREIQGRRADRGDSGLHSRLPAVRRGRATGPIGPREELREGRAVRGRSGESVERGGRCARRRRGRVWCTRRSWMYVGGLSAGVTVGMTVLLFLGCDARTIRRNSRVSEQ